MIRIVKKCLGKSEVVAKKWDFHPAFLHFKSFTNCYINGKPLKWYHFLKNGDHIEVIERPGEPTSTIALFTWLGAWLVGATGIGFGLTTTQLAILGGIALVGAVTAVGTGIYALAGGFSGVGNAGATGSKEYSSTTNPELKGASNDIGKGIIPVVFGRVQQTPCYGQFPYIGVDNGTGSNKLYQYFIANYNNVVYSDFKLGDTFISDYSIDYININQAIGSANFIGFDNVKKVDINEELSYNPDGQVNNSAIVYYNQSTTSATLKIDFQLQFTNVDINNWSQKQFQQVSTVVIAGVQVQLSQNFTIAASQLVNQGSNTYTYNNTASYDLTSTSQTITELITTQFAPISPTRGNAVESTNELSALYVSETVTTDDYTDTQTVNDSINQYGGTPSECLATSPDNTTDIDVIISFPQGLYKINGSNRQSRNATVEIMYKTPNGQYVPFTQGTTLYIRDMDGNKSSVPPSITVNGSNVTFKSPSNIGVADQMFYGMIGFTVPAGKYIVRIRSGDYAEKTNMEIGVPYANQVQFRMDEPVLNEAILPKVNQIGFEAIAYKGLSGTLQKFNYIAEAKIPIWNGTDWNTIDKSSNPAAIVRWLLTSRLVNPRPEPLNYIDNDSFVAAYEWCEQEQYKADGIESGEKKTGAIIDTILRNAQLTMIPLWNGKHTIVIDNQDKVPVGLFNQHNSWGFVWTPLTGKVTSAIRANFVNNDEWVEDEFTLYWWDGAVHDAPKEGTTDEDYLLVKEDYDYVRDKASLVKYVTYKLTTIQTKRNNFEFKVNLEGLNLKLLDRCYVTNTANMQNEVTGLIHDVVTENGMLKGFKIGSLVDIPENAKIIIRSLDYTNERPVINVYDVINSGRSSFIGINPIPYDCIVKGMGEIQGLKDKWFYDGDLFTLGQQTIYDCVITDIRYNQDLTATITARDF
ncbi:MAG: hypothetical protein LBK53_09340 [Heliobacteriaceae bacterium]|jgi:hypothetical protein|nr:hypothetical protein [Heliobacteriaceae bacterium]